MSVVVVGLGNAYRGDDGVGLAVAAAVRARVGSEVSVAPCEEEPSRLLDAWSGSAAAVIVDAVVSGAEPGTIHRLDASEEPIPAGTLRSSTHAFSLGETIEIARALGRLPRRVLVYGIEAADVAAGEQLTPAVAGAVEHVADAIVRDLERLMSEEIPCTSER
jgi:hydrogenase maturation protease